MRPELKVLGDGPRDTQRPVPADHDTERHRAAAGKFQKSSAASSGLTMAPLKPRGGGLERAVGVAERSAPERSSSRLQTETCHGSFSTKVRLPRSRPAGSGPGRRLVIREKHRWKPPPRLGPHLLRTLFQSLRLSHSPTVLAWPVAGGAVDPQLARLEQHSCGATTGRKPDGRNIAAALPGGSPRGS
jgi:hypothetical protein